MSTENPGRERVVPAGRFVRWIYREPQGWRPGLFMILAWGAIAVGMPLLLDDPAMQLAWATVGLAGVAGGIAEFFPTDRQISANLLRMWAAGVATGVAAAIIVTWLFGV
jgi:phage shock protein PspC (stress-responsive transcriptional regulator)